MIDNSTQVLFRARAYCSSLSLWLLSVFFPVYFFVFVISSSALACSASSRLPLFRFLSRSLHPLSLLLFLPGRRSPGRIVVLVYSRSLLRHRLPFRASFFLFSY